ncbi:ABC transporter ATP-binding protein [Alcaligenaceae bacterium SJ-26]|nr:ABC transporter ATP-binding protein [Alcaligenaceae bacterium SJ-26]
MTLAPLLQVDAVGKSFGALQALDDISFDLKAGETLGLIGPNGAGKTTLFNILSGFLVPDRGQVRFMAQDIGSWDPMRRAQSGVVRTFQKSLVFPDMSVCRNLALALLALQGNGYRWWGGRRALAVAEAKARQLLAASPLADNCQTRVGDMSYGAQRMVDILIALAQQPRLLLLDEPTAGLTVAEAAQLLGLVRQLHADAAVVLIAHDMDVVFRECDRIAVLNLGRLVAVDTPERIRSHEAVRQAYLGALARQEV